jgi:polysaccharide biosynthesis protein PslH
MPYGAGSPVSRRTDVGLAPPSADGRDQWPAAAPAHSACSHRLSLKTLFVTSGTPFPPIAGSSQRSALLIEGLRRLGPVDLFLYGDAAMKRYLEDNGYSVAAACQPQREKRSLLLRLLTALLGNHGLGVWRFLLGTRVDYEADPGLREQLAQVVASGGYDLVVGRYLVASARAGVFTLRNVPVVIDVDDADSKVLKARIASPATRPWTARLLALRVRAVEAWQRRLWPRAAMVWLSNPQDADLAPQRALAVIPNIPFQLPPQAQLAPSADGARVVLWVGSFDHRVNLDGVELFIESVWPKVVQLDPSLVFRIVGSHLPDAKKQQWMRVPQVEVVGFAASLDEHYAQCAFSVVPLFDGAGTKIKVLESLGHMRSCVVSTHAIKGYEALLHDDQSLLVADSMDGLVEPIVRLASAPDLRHRLERNGRELVELQCGREAMFTGIAKALQALPGGHAQ